MARPRFRRARPPSLRVPPSTWAQWPSLLLPLSPNRPVLSSQVVCDHCSCALAPRIAPFFWPALLPTSARLQCRVRLRCVPFIGLLRGAVSIKKVVSVAVPTARFTKKPTPVPGKAVAKVAAVVAPSTLGACESQTGPIVHESKRGMCFCTMHFQEWLLPRRLDLPSRISALAACFSRVCFLSLLRRYGNRCPVARAAAVCSRTSG